MFYVRNRREEFSKQAFHEYCLQQLTSVTDLLLLFGKPRYVHHFNGLWLRYLQNILILQTDSALALFLRHCVPEKATSEHRNMTETENGQTTTKLLLLRPIVDVVVLLSTRVESANNESARLYECYTKV